MAKLTIFFGVLLILVGAVAFTELAHHLHTLIPVAFGLLLAIIGALANRPDSKKRMLFMHIAVTVGLLGFLGTIPGIVATIRRAAGQVVVSPVPAAATVQATMGVICLVFVLLCVRSFIAARRSRTSTAA
jgi:hypothetical protein